MGTIAEHARIVNGIRIRSCGRGASIGDQHEWLLVLGEQFAIGGIWRMVCECKCGRVLVVRVEHVTRKGASRSTSCGCRRRLVTTQRSTTHGQSPRGAPSRLYRIWFAMKARCGNQKSFGYKWYGAKGIKVCQVWANDFAVFQAWAMANGYADDLTIDREKSTGNYEPDNCRWITQEENSRLAMEQRWHKPPINSLRSI